MEKRRLSQERIIITQPRKNNDLDEAGALLLRNVQILDVLPLDVI